MRVVTDLHLHSKYSRAVSPQMTLPVMAKVAREKGLQLLTASDWTHPVWFKEISTLLEEAGEGVYRLKQMAESKEQVGEIRFILSTEISSIYKQDGKLRRIHNLIFVSSLAKAEEFSQVLVKRGCNIAADGRPIVGLSSRNLLELLLETDENGFLIPCHVWTPHFGLYGSASGFDSIEEAFGDLSSYIYGIETGLSSDPEMNWQIKELHTRSILSFSDAHSPAKMGREATIVDLAELNFPNLKQSFRKGESEVNKVLFTVEFYPEEGKYHSSGHRNCKVRYTPEELTEKGSICPVCKRNFTEGVFVRLSHLAGTESTESALSKRNEEQLRWLTDPHNNQPPYVKMVPLLEIIAESLGVGVSSQKVKDAYAKALQTTGSELDILLHVPVATIAAQVSERVASGVLKVRTGDIIIDPGYDGEYGKVRIWRDGESPQSILPTPQLALEF